MGAFLEKPITTKETEEGEGNGIKYAVSAMQGWRKEMEDKHISNTKFRLEGHAFFGVFDGHAGSQASEYCSEKLLDHILTDLPSSPPPSPEIIQKSLKEGFTSLDKKMFDDLGFPSSKMRGGTTAVTAMITPDKIIWANCGDSRGILCRKEKLLFSTEDHKPYMEGEKKRIVSAGGNVMMQRVNGSLAVSRALGDFEFKTDEAERGTLSKEPTTVIAEPDVTITDRAEDDEFLLLACDGIYDVLTNDEIVDFVHKKLLTTSSLPDICNALIDFCLNKNSRDNMSVILVTFPGAPSVCPAAVEEEKKRLESAKMIIEEVVKDAIEQCQDPLDIDEMNIMGALAIKTDVQDHPLRGFDFYLLKPLVGDKIAELKKNKFKTDEQGFEEGATDSSEAPDFLSKFQVPAADIFQSDNAMETTEGDSASGKDSLSTPQQTDSSTNSV